MTSLMAMRRKNRQRKNKPMAANPPRASVVVRPDATGSSFIGGVGFQVVVFLIAFLIVCSRRPDAVLNAQFWAEDGMMWYAGAYNLGLRSVLMQQGSYLHVSTRLVALFSLLFPLSAAPLVTNLCAITVKILPVNVFLSSRFSQIGLRTRLLASFVYLALPNSHEVHANFTAIQWHLALLACVLMLAEPAAAWGWRFFTGVVLVMISLDAAIVFLLVPLAAALWWKRREPGDATNFALLLPGAAIQAFTVLLTWQSRQVAPNGASFGRLVTILGRQIFLPSLLGLNTVSTTLRGETATLTETIAAAMGLAVLSYTLFRGPLRLKLLILFTFSVLALCLARPLAGTLEREQWDWLCVPGCGNRYYFLPMLAFLASLLWMASQSASPHVMRYFAVVLLLLLPIGIYRDWRYPAYKDYHFREYAEQFEHAPAGTKMIIPINPDWSMELTKR